MKKRLFSLFLACVMALGMLPTVALAENTPDTIEVTMSVFNQGVPVLDKENKAVLLRTVQVSDINGDGCFSLDEALTELHKSALTVDSYAAGADSFGYYSVSKLWGVETSAVGFYKNHLLTAAVNEESLSSGDQITAYIYKDQAGWSDRYTYFSQDTLLVCEDTEFQVTLSYDAWGTVFPQATAPLGVFDQDTGTYSVPSAMRGELLFGDFYMPTVSTDASGNAVMSFTEPGTYLLTAQYDSSNYSYYDDQNNQQQYYLVPPLCQVTVLSAEDYAKATLEVAKEALVWSSLSSEAQNALTTAPMLPASLTVDGREVTISWSCNDPTYALSVYGTSAYINRPAAQDAPSTLTATLVYNDQTTTKEFAVSVKAEGVSEDKESVCDFAALMDSIAATYTSSTDAWTILDMAAYGSSIKGDGYGYSSAAPTALAEAALGQTPDLSALTAFDPNGAYAIYTTPYVLLAYDAAGADDSGFTTKRSDLKDAMVAYLNAMPGNYADTDEVTPILAALAPYYNRGDAALDAAVSAAITWLSQCQNSDGTFSYYGTPNANSTAFAVVALSALGIDAHTDSRFVKDKSAMDGLFSFALSTLDGFGYKGNVTKNTLATEQGFRALVAYARFAEQNSAYNIYLDADVSQTAPAAPQISTTVPAQPGGPSSGDGEEDTITVSFALKTHRETWIEAHAVTVNAGATVADVFYQVLDGREAFGYVDKNGYISSITFEDTTWAEFNAGPNSGWKYMVNGVAPGAGMNDKVLADGDQIVWYYVTDYTQDTGRDEERFEAEESPAPELPFPDVDGHWAQEYIQFCYDKGLMSGTGTTTFSPNATLNRGMVVTILHALAGKPAPSSANPFDDVASDAWYTDAVVWAAGEDIVSGYGGGTFGPEDNVTREQLAAILWRYAQFSGLDVGVNEEIDILRYTDAYAISDWALTPLRWACGAGLLEGNNGLLMPQNEATRAQMATVLTNYLDFVQ